MVSNTAFFMGAPENAWCDTIMNGEKVITGMRVIKEAPYSFTSVEQLIQDFKTDIERLRGDYDE